MTAPAEPEQRYITTDEDFDFIWKNINSPLVVRDRINVIKSRQLPYPPKMASGNEHYNGVCAFQDKCNDYSDFIESIEDELDPDDEDPVCPIRCDFRGTPYPQETPAQQPQEFTVGMVCAFESGQKDERIRQQQRIADVVVLLEDKKRRTWAMKNGVEYYPITVEELDELIIRLGGTK